MFDDPDALYLAGDAEDDDDFEDVKTKKKQRKKGSAKKKQPSATKKTTTTSSNLVSLKLAPLLLLLLLLPPLLLPAQSRHPSHLPPRTRMMQSPLPYQTTMTIHRRRMATTQKTRPGYPKTGHYETWLIDALQNIHREVYGTTLFTGWMNASDYAETEETFGIVPLADIQLSDAINKAVDEATPKIDLGKMTPDVKYLAKKTKLKVPALPWSGEREFKLFSELSAASSNDKNLEKMCYDILPSVDGRTVFPKLAVYNRKHDKKCKSNLLIKDAARKTAKEREQLDKVMEATATEVTEADEGAAMMPPDDADDDEGVVDAEEGGLEGVDPTAPAPANPPAAPAPANPPAAPAPANPPNPPQALPNTHLQVVPAVARPAIPSFPGIGVSQGFVGINPGLFLPQMQQHMGMISIHVDHNSSAPEEQNPRKRKRGRRMGNRDSEKRRKRTCKQCKREDCPMAAPTGKNRKCILETEESQE